MAKIDPPDTDFREWFFELWRNRGLRDDQIAIKWREYTDPKKKGK